MGLFSLTKKPEEKKLEAQKLPSFPEFPAVHEELPEFPAYEPTIGEIKKEITRPEEFEVPVRDKKAERNMFATQLQPQPAATKLMPTERTLFIKIDKYKDAMHDIQSLKIKIAEAERILTGLEELKAEEDSKLSKWNSEIQELKEKLLSLDRNLFEA